MRCSHRFSKKEIFRILNDNLHRIEKAYSKLQNQTVLKEEMNKFLFCGEMIDIIETINPNAKNQTAKIENNKLYLELHSPLTPEMKEIIRKFIYKQHAPHLFLDKVEYFANKMQLFPNKVSFRKAKTRWGSCSSINNISLNIGLCALPRTLSDYVIIHELAHIKHKNHSKDFWNLVSKHCPNYKEARKELKKYGSFV